MSRIGPQVDSRRKRLEKIERNKPEPHDYDPRCPCTICRAEYEKREKRLAEWLRSLDEPKPDPPQQPHPQVSTFDKVRGWLQRKSESDRHDGPKVEPKPI